MKLKIRSLAGSIEKYEDLLNNKLDWDKHYHVHYSGIRDNGYGVSTKVEWDELKDVEVDSLEHLFDIFEEFKEGMGEGFGHITVDVKEGIIYVLDSWVE